MPTDAALPDETPSFVPDDAFVAAVRHRVRRHRRRTRQRLGAGVTLVAVIAGSGLWYTNDRLSSVQRIDLGTDPTDADNRRYFATNVNGSIFENTATLSAAMPEVGEPPIGQVLK